MNALGNAEFVCKPLKFDLQTCLVRAGNHEIKFWERQGMAREGLDEQVDAFFRVDTTRRE